MDSVCRLVGYFIVFSFPANVIGFGLGGQTVSNLDETSYNNLSEDSISNTKLLLMAGTAFLIPTLYAAIVYGMWMHTDTNERR